MSVEATPPVTSIETSEDVSRSIRDYYASKMHDAVNGFALTNALFAFVEAGLLDDLNRDGYIDAASAAERHGYKPDQLLGLLRYLTSQDVFKERDRFYATPFGDAVFSKAAVGRLWLYRGGYGRLMFEAGRLLDGSLTYGKELTREGEYVSKGSSSATSSFYDEVALKIIDRLGARTLVDLGCGAADFLISYVKRSPDNRGIGVDLDPGGLAEAGRRTRAAGVAERIQLIEGDAFGVDGLARTCNSADLFFAFGMVHEVLRDGEEGLLDFIDRMAVAFPGKRFLIGEPIVNRTREDGAFYWLHILSKQGIPLPLAGWTKLLGRLKKAKLEMVYRPDHEMVAAYFQIAFPGR
jgi:hypothetical protein